VARILKVRSVSGTPAGHAAPHVINTRLLELPFAHGIDSAKREIRTLVQAAILKCGSAAELARTLGVKPPTVSQWRAGRKLPDVLHFIQIQKLAKQSCESHDSKRRAPNFTLRSSSVLNMAKRRETL
jgi:hypothetical protein